MIGRAPRVAAITAAALALGLALTGCGKLDARPGPALSDSPPTGSTSGSTAAPAPAASTSADDSGSLDGITQDLDSASTANSEADSNAQAGDQAAASGDEP